MTWNQIGPGCYETSDRQFQAKRHENGLWMLLQHDDDARPDGWVWAQSFRLLRETKAAAQSIQEAA